MTAAQGIPPRDAILEASRTEGASVGPLVVVMGVSGSGKSTVGALVAAELGVVFVDGDALHPAANVAKMASGIPLTDADREPWLDAVGRTLAEGAADGLVLACSALKRAYRDRIRSHAPATLFAALDGTEGELAARMVRPGHFMPPSLLASQLATLQPLQDDERGLCLNVEATPDAIAATIAERARADFR